MRCLAILSVCLVLSCGTAKDEIESATKVLDRWGRMEANPVSTAHQKQINQLFLDAANLNLLLSWALQHPAQFSQRLSYFKEAAFYHSFAELVVEGGKSFALIEMLIGSPSLEAERLLKAIRARENLDARIKVSAQTKSSAIVLQSIIALEGETATTAWRGAALLVAQNRCQVALVTAGHNVLDGRGELRAPLSQLYLHLPGGKQTITEVFPQTSPIPSAQDWAILVANKNRCADQFESLALEPWPFQQIPEQGLDVSLFCFHQSQSDVIPSLYAEQCRIYPSETGVLKYYANQPAGKLGIHTCQSVTGSSGCPVLYNDGEQNYFLGMQIEGDRLTGAGIARLVRDDFAKAIRQVKARLVQQVSSG